MWSCQGCLGLYHRFIAFTTIADDSIDDARDGPQNEPKNDLPDAMHGHPNVTELEPRRSGPITIDPTYHEQ
jgi:hypothetical protein